MKGSTTPTMPPSLPPSSDLLVEWSHADANDRREVRFNENVKFRIIEDTSRMTPQEVHSLWYQKHENQDMRRDMKKTVKRMAKGYPEDNVNRSYRGLEHLLSRDALLSLQEGRDRLAHAVLRSQEMGLTPHEIASTASQLSKSSRDRALWYGKNDEKEAKDINETASLSASNSHSSYSHGGDSQVQTSSHIAHRVQEFQARLHVEDEAFR